MWNDLLMEIKIYLSIFESSQEIIPEVEGQICLSVVTEQETNSK